MTTSKELIEEVRKIAKENPDFVYAKQEGRDTDDKCSYFGRAIGVGLGTPCIVGQALKNLEVDTSALKVYEEEVLGIQIGDVLERELLNVEYNDSELNWLNRVQFSQDIMGSWSEAVSYADNGYTKGEESAA